MSLKEILSRLQELADPQKIIYKEKKFGIQAKHSLGIYMKDLNTLAREIGKNESLALELFQSNIYEGKILCSKIFRPKFLRSDLADSWLIHFENWEICDSFCMGVVAKSPLAKEKILAWTKKDKEFEKRAGFATMAAYCMADKSADNEVFLQFLSLIVQSAEDERLYVKKAVNWALRSIGKRNTDLKVSAIQIAYQLLKLESKSAQWIAKDALKELQKADVRMSDYPRSLYRAMP